MSLWYRNAWKWPKWLYDYTIIQERKNNVLFVAQKRISQVLTIIFSSLSYNTFPSPDTSPKETYQFYEGVFP